MLGLLGAAYFYLCSILLYEEIVKPVLLQMHDRSVLDG